MSEESKEDEVGEDLNFHTDMQVGEILRRTRTHYGQSLQQIEQVLRIRASNLDALEKGDISQLPGRVYAIGFVRSYSEYLGLDGDKMVHLFKEQSVGAKKKVDLSFPVPATESKVPNRYIVGVSLLALIVLLVFITYVFFPDENPKDVPPVPDSLTGSSLNEAPSLIESANQQTTAQTQATPEAVVEDAKPTNRIVLEIKDASWVEIKNASGAAILRQVLKAGDIYLVPPEEGLILSTGNAGGIVVKVDEKTLPSLGEDGEIKRKIPLNPDVLLKSIKR